MIPQSLESNIIFLCGEFTHLFHRVLTAEFKNHRVGVTVEQFAILALLYYRNGISQQEISSLLKRDKTTITRVIGNMEKSQLIVRLKNKQDTRGNLIHLTPKGKAIQNRAVERSGKLYLATIDRLNANQLKAGVKLMDQMIRNLSK